MGDDSVNTRPPATYAVYAGAFTCLICGTVSRNPYDVANHFCAHCGVVHRDG